MSVSAVGSDRSQAYAKEQADAEYFNLLFKAEQRKAEAEKEASKPVNVVLGGESMELDRDFASALMHAIEVSLDEIKAHPEGHFKLPNGITATGQEIMAAHAAFILAGLT